MHFSDDGASTACVVRQFGAHLAPRPPRQIPSMRQFGAPARPPSSMPSKRRARSGPFVKCVNASTHRQCTVKSGPVLGPLLSPPLFTFKCMIRVYLRLFRPPLPLFHANELVHTLANPSACLFTPASCSEVAPTWAHCRFVHQHVMTEMMSTNRTR